MASTKKRLQELRGSSFELAKGQPDIRGWEVLDTAGHKIGKVHELVLDTEAGKVRYMIMNISDSKELQLEKRTVLLPIGLAELHRAHDSVVLPQVTPYQLRALPKYDKEHLGPKAEMDISAVFGRSHTAIGTDDAHGAPFYDHDHFNNDNLFRGRSKGDESQSNRQEESSSPRRTSQNSELLAPKAYTPEGSSADEDAIRRNRDQTNWEDDENRRTGRSVD
jgi:hypothetical protein